MRMTILCEEEERWQRIHVNEGRGDGELMMRSDVILFISSAPHSSIGEENLAD